MLHTLHNDQLWVQVSAHGAEPMHLRDKTGTELLWQGDPAVWPRRAPLLFPFIGRLKNETYTVGGQAYHIPIHGFGPDSDFTPVEQSDTALTLRLTDSDATRAQYPFAFQLDVRFTLDGNRLTKACTMTNRSDVPLAYELGGHEGYRVALAADECAADAYIDCGAETVLHPYCSDEALYLLDKTREVPLENGRLYLRPGLFAQDALILSDLKQRSLTHLEPSDHPVRLCLHRALEQPARFPRARHRADRKMGRAHPRARRVRNPALHGNGRSLSFSHTLRCISKTPQSAAFFVFRSSKACKKNSRQSAGRIQKGTDLINIL